MFISSRRGSAGRLPLASRDYWAGLGMAAVLVLVATALVADQQTRPEVVRIHVGDVPLLVEVVDNPRLRARGLKYREALAADAGMLFVYPEPGILRFWMQDTLIDLDIGFFDDQARLIEIQQMAARHEQSHYVSGRPAKYALEVNRGWFAANRIPANAALRLPRALDAR